MNAYAKDGRLDTFTASFLADTGGFMDEPAQINAIGNGAFIPISPLVPGEPDGSIGGAVESDGGLVPISPEVGGIAPTFDPTDVIIPRGGVRGR